ncbi:MAG TPA: response regulator, partial [Longimicrobiales bacterium]|nr:response regulator [Longimicrobiales bacterium]
LDSLGPGDALRADLEEIERAGMRAAGLTQQLLAFSRRQMMQPRPMDLNAAITGMTRMLDRLTGDAVELRVCLEASLATIMADPAQLEQVVVNLTVNAREAMPDGGILTISTDNTEIAPEEPRIAGYGLGPGRYVRLMVEDSGAGMSPETLARVFDPFFSTKEQAPGTGLGLATVFGIIKQSGGHITAETQRDAGSRFVAYLPVAEQTAETGEPTVQDAPEDEGLGTVLLAEDEEAVRRLTARVLQRHGYTVLAAENGTAALEVFRRDPAGVDLVLSDLVMPGMGGRDLVRAIHELRPSMPIIFMSGYEEEMARSGAQERAAQFLAKPFSPRDLVATVAAVFREHVRT